MTEPKLLPCPFCGGEATTFVEFGVKVICTDCGASTKEIQDEKIEDFAGKIQFATDAIKCAVTAWNRRVPQEVHIDHVENLNL